MSEAVIFQIATRDDPRVFTLAEAEELFPLVWRLTRAAHEGVTAARQVL